MTAWVILAGLAIVVIGVVAKVGHDVVAFLREDRAAHGGRQTAAAARRAILVAGIVLALIVVLIVWPLLLGDG